MKEILKMQVYSKQSKRYIQITKMTDTSITVIYHAMYLYYICSSKKKYYGFVY